MMGFVRLTLGRLVGVSVLMSALGANAAGAEEPRTVDFAGGLVLGSDPPAGEAMPGVAGELRFYGSTGGWLAARASLEPSADLSNPEDGDLVVAWIGGLAGGLWLDLSPRLTLLAGGSAEGVLADEARGVRGGPLAGAALVLGQLWGHPLAVEARASWLVSRWDDGRTTTGWQAGLYVTGTLFPDRPLAR
jgi:hypothetical protein